MNLRFVASCGLCAALVFTGCSDGGRTAPGKTTVQVANAAPGFEYLDFQRERPTAENPDRIQFRDGRTYVFDADTYDFYVDEPITTPGVPPEHGWTFASTLEAKTLYQFVLTEVAGEVVPVVIKTPPPPAAADTTQALALHAGTSLPAMDLYLERTGVGIAGATPRGTFNAGEQIAPFTLPSGDYEVFVTAAGNPADVWLTSTPFNLLAGVNSTFVVVDEKGTGTARISVLLIQETSTLLFDKNAPSQLRALNAATDQAPRDVAVESQFSPPLFSATQFGVPTPYAQVPLGAIKVNVTPVGNPGVLELDTPMTGTIGQRVTMMFNGPAGALVPAFGVDDGRRLNREAKVRFMNAAAQFIAVDFIFTFPDDSPDDSLPLAQLFPPSVAAYTSVPPGDYDLYLRDSVSLATLMGPMRLSVAASGIYGVLAVDGPDTATANAILFDDFVP